jgi:hypothetical protein
MEPGVSGAGSFLSSEADVPYLPNGHPATWVQPQTSSSGPIPSSPVLGERTRLTNDLAVTETLRLEADARRVAYDEQASWPGAAQASAETHSPAPLEDCTR